MARIPTTYSGESWSSGGRRIQCWRWTWHATWGHPLKKQSVSNPLSNDVTKYMVSTHWIWNRRSDTGQHYWKPPSQSLLVRLQNNFSPKYQRSPPHSPPSHALVSHFTNSTMSRTNAYAFNWEGREGRNAFLNPYPVPHCSILVIFSCSRLLIHASNSCLKHTSTVSKSSQLIHLPFRNILDLT